MKSIPNKVLMFGPDNSHALGVVRELAAANIDFEFLVQGKAQKCATKSRYCRKFREFASYDDALDYAIKNYGNAFHKAILLAMGDLIAEKFDNRYSELSKLFYLSGTKQQGLLTKFDDKNLMCEKARVHGFSVPYTKEYKLGDDLSDVPYPCIIKPNIVNSRGEFKTKILQNKEEFDSFKRYLSPQNSYVIQQYISKEYDLLVYGCRMKDGSVVLSGTYYKDRWSDDGGASHGYVIAEIPDYCNRKGIASFLADIDYYGLFSVEYGLEKGVAYFYEFNLRNDGTTNVFFGGGANLPAAWAFDCADIEFDGATKVDGKRYVINETLDQINIIKGVVSKEQWKKDYAQATIFYFYDKDDIEPWRIAKKGLWYKLRINSLLHEYKPVIVHWLRKIGFKK